MLCFIAIKEKVNILSKKVGTNYFLIIWEQNYLICVSIGTMFIKETVVKKNNKEYRCSLLVESIRVNGKPRHKTICNVSNWSKEKIDNFKTLLKSSEKPITTSDLTFVQGKKFGALLVFKQLADELGITKSLPKGKTKQLALLLIIGRILTQGSRLKLCRWSENQEISSILKLDGFSEDALYKALINLSNEQSQIETKLSNFRHKASSNRMFLYDVTSSYLEGTKNELAEYGYNRDKKKGKKQIVIGLLTDKNGNPFSIMAFKGNTSDNQTVFEQLQKIKKQFAVEDITFIGDRGMLKSSQIEDVVCEGFSYITAITKPQIQKLLNEKILQPELFDENVSEVELDGIRYVLKKNPQRIMDLMYNRLSKYNKVSEKAKSLTEKLYKSGKCKIESALKEMNTLIKKFKLDNWLEVYSEERVIKLKINEEKYLSETMLDGCYVIKTNVNQNELSVEEVHDSYKYLSKVERAFRTLKTGHLELRPIFLQKEAQTRGHVLVSMLAYILVLEFINRTKDLGMRLDEMVEILDNIQTVIVDLPEGKSQKLVPSVSDKAKSILNALNISLPKRLK